MYYGSKNWKNSVITEGQFLFLNRKHFVKLCLNVITLSKIDRSFLRVAFFLLVVDGERPSQLLGEFLFDQSIHFIKSS